MMTDQQFNRTWNIIFLLVALGLFGLYRFATSAEKAFERKCTVAGGVAIGYACFDSAAVKAIK
jgi:hypothetical protein